MSGTDRVSGTNLWTVEAAALPGGAAVRLTARRDGRPATAGEVLNGLSEDPEYRSAWNAALAGLPFAAFRWELPALTAATLGRPFECVSLADPALDRPPDPAAFADRFAAHPDEPVLTFPNLGGDAVLIVPRPAEDPAACGHLGAFVRQAPAERRDALWRAVGAACAARVGGRPVWLNTAGAGVPWLNVRLDDRPKYYRHAPYRRPPA